MLNSIEEQHRLFQAKRKAPRRFKISINDDILFKHTDYSTYATQTVEFFYTYSKVHFVAQTKRFQVARC